MTTVLSTKGQVTIPKTIRDKLGLKPGTVLVVAAVNGKLVAEKSDTMDPFGRWRGAGKLPGNLDVDDYLRRCRG